MPSRASLILMVAKQFRKGVRVWCFAGAFDDPDEVDPYSNKFLELGGKNHKLYGVIVAKIRGKDECMVKFDIPGEDECD